MTETNPSGNPLAEFKQTLKAMRSEAAENEKPGLDMALFALGDDGTDLGGFEDEFASDAALASAEMEMPPEPIRKSVAGLSAGSAALLILWAAQQLGVPMDQSVALAIAGLLGGAVAYFKREY